MKIVAVSNHDKDTFSQYFVAENIATEEEAKRLCKQRNAKVTDWDTVYYRVVPDDYELYIWEP